MHLCAHYVFRFHLRAGGRGQRRREECRYIRNKLCIQVEVFLVLHFKKMHVNYRLCRIKEILVD